MFGFGAFGGVAFGGTAHMQSASERNKVLLDAHTPSLLMQAVIVPGEDTDDGLLVAAVALPWFDIIELIRREPETVYKIHWRKWEEIIAAAYTRQGFDVVLTPRANDGGRDVIASFKGIGAVRFFDQVKAYTPGHLVTAEEVRAMVGVLTLEPNVSKGIITTTSGFAPGVLTAPEIARLTPYRLELKGRDDLVDWLSRLATNNQTDREPA